MTLHSASAQNKRRLQLVLALSAAYLCVEVIGGILTRSLALLAVAGHMLTDVSGLGFALAAVHFAAPGITHQDVWVLSGRDPGGPGQLGSADWYLALHFVRSVPAVPHATRGGQRPDAAGGWFWTGSDVAGVLILREHAQRSLNLKGAYFEVLSDLLTSIGVLVAGLIMLTTGWYYADPLISAGIGLFILPRTWALLKESVGVLLEGVPSDVNLAELCTAISALPGVADVHDLHVWSLTSGSNAMSAHVVVADGAAYADVLGRVQLCVTERFGIAHATVQVEPPGWERGEPHL